MELLYQNLNLVINPNLKVDYLDGGGDGGLVHLMVKENIIVKRIFQVVDIVEPMGH